MLQQSHVTLSNGLQSFAEASPEYELAPLGVASMPGQLQKLAEHGRNGDIYIVHAAEGETVVPMEVLDANPKVKALLFGQMRDMGLDPHEFVVGDDLNSINPDTGLPEFFFKSIFRKVKRLAKKVWKGFKKAAPIILPIAATMFGVPFLGAAMPGIFGAGMAGSSMLASGVGSLLAGGSLKDAFKSAGMAGLTSGIMGGLKGAGAFKSFGVPGGGQGFMEGAKSAFYNPNMVTAGITPASQWGQFTEGLKGKPGAWGRFFEPVIGGGKDPTTGELYPGGLTPRPDYMPKPQVVAGSDAMFAAADPTTIVPGATLASPGEAVAPQMASDTMATFTDAASAEYGIPVGSRGYTPPQIPSAIPAGGAPLKLTPQFDVTSGGGQVIGGAEEWARAGIPAPEAARAGPVEAAAKQWMGPPSRIGPSAQVPGAVAQTAASRGPMPANFTADLQAGVDALVASRQPFPGAGFSPLSYSPSPLDIQQVAQGLGYPLTTAQAQTALTTMGPGMLKTWGPAAAIGAGAAYGMGAFDEEEPPDDPDESDLTFTKEMGPTAQERLAEDRERIARGEKPKYYLPPEAVDPLHAWRPEDYEYQNYYATAADGGLATYPRRENLVEGPGTERSDDIPAMLSDGEFVINSRAVRGADPTGGGNRYAGAKNLYNMMRNFEMRA